MDIDECTFDDLNKCSDNSDCINTDGSFICACKEGYYSIGDECFDVDECSSDKLHDCPENSECENTDGSYYCTCQIGFVGSIDSSLGLKCFNINECFEEVIRSCEFESGAICEDTYGGFECSCPSNMLGTGKYGDPCIKEVVCGRKIQTGCHLF